MLRISLESGLVASEDLTQTVKPADGRRGLPQDRGGAIQL